MLRAATVAATAGDLARGLLVVLVSAYLLAAAATDDPSRSKSLGAALRSFERLPAGPAILALAAAGLASFAAYSALEAVYGRV